MSVSKFAEIVNHPLCEYMDRIPFAKGNVQKEKIHFLSGDPTAYGNNAFRMPEEGYEIIRNVIKNEENHGYCLSTGIPPVRSSIAKLYNSKIPINEANVVVQHGVNQGLLSALMAFTNPGDDILVPQIGYPIFQKLAPAMNVNVKHYKLRKQKNFEIDLEHAASLITEKTQFMFVINPSNPMGTVFSRKHMEEILEFCDAKQLPLVADEVYFRQNFSGEEFFSFGEITENVPVIVLSGYKVHNFRVEKILSVPGWSTSWSILFDKNGYLQRVWSNVLTTCTMFLHTNKFTQIGLSEILQKVGIFTSEKIQAIKPIHDDLCSKFSSMKGYTPIKAQGTIYLTVQIDVKAFKDIENDIDFVNKLLEEENVLFLPLSLFGGKLNGFRLLTCANEQLYVDLLERIKLFNTHHQE